MARLFSGSFSSHLLTTFMTNAVMACVGLATGVMAARLLGPQGRGELAAIQTWPTDIAVFAMLGLDAATVYFSARDPERAGRYLASATSFVLLSALPFMVAAYCLMPVLLAAQSTAIIHAARWYLLLILLFPFAGMPFNALRGRSDLNVWNVLRTMPGLGWLLVLLTGLILGETRPQWFAGGFLLMLAVFSIPVFIVTRRRVPGPFVPERRLWKPMLKYGVPSAAGSVPRTFNLRLDQMLMAAVLAPRLLGLYVVGVAWSGAIAPATNAIGAVIFPRVASQKLVDARDRSLGQATRLGTVVAAGLGFVLLALTPWGVPLLFGASFAPAVPAALILTVAGALMGLNTILEEGVRGLGDTKAILWSELAGLVVTIAGLAFLLRPYNIVGAALTSLLAYTTISICLLVRIRNKTGYPVAKLLWPKVEDLALARQWFLSMVRG